MKFRVKLLFSAIGLTAAVLLAAVLLKYSAAVPAKLRLFEPTEKPDKFAELTAGSTIPARLPRYTSEIFSETDSDRNALAQMLQKTACRTVLALLPENSRIISANPPELLNSNSALIKGSAAIPGNSSRAEKVLDFSAKVNFIARIGCEAEFPEFSSL